MHEEHLRGVEAGLEEDCKMEVEEETDCKKKLDEQKKSQLPQLHGHGFQGKTEGDVGRYNYD